MQIPSLLCKHTYKNSHIEFGATVSTLRCNSVKRETQTAAPCLCFYSQSNINVLIKYSVADLLLSCPQVCALCNIGSRYYWISLSLSRESIVWI